MRLLLAILSLLVASGCSAPRYTYFFPRPAAEVETGGEVARVTLEPPALSTVHASANSNADSYTPAVTRNAQTRAARPRPKEIIQPQATYDQPADLPVKDDPDLRRAAIFGVAGLVALVIGGNLFWVVGSLSLLIGLIFAIKWLLRK